MKNNSKLKTKNSKLQRICSNCWFVRAAEGLARPILVCNRKKGAGKRLFVVEPADYCPNFIQNPIPSLVDFIDAHTALIPLTQGKFAIVDAADYPALNRFKWFATKGDKTYYAARAQNRKIIRMHRVIMAPPEGMSVDHINHNGLDNRRSNLRICTFAQNMYNRRSGRKQKTSKYKGVKFRKLTKRYRAVIYLNRKHIHIGCFKNEIDAAKAYDAKARELFGEFACLNFPNK